jgi:hypothetical protein
MKNNNRKNKVETAILLGNGINLLTEGVTWAGLLNHIAQEMNVVIEINNNKTFPMIFEEILFRSEGDFYLNLRTIKELIANQYLNTIPNVFHHRVMNLNVTDYLTTNYDYSLERVFEPNFNISCIDINKGQIMEIGTKIRRIFAKFWILAVLGQRY